MTRLNQVSRCVPLYASTPANLVEPTVLSGRFMATLRSVMLAACCVLFTGGTACSDATGTGCCRVLTTGKACGDSCIARDKTCNAGPGCACNG